MQLTMSQVPEIQLIELEALESIYSNELSGELGSAFVPHFAHKSFDAVVSRSPTIKFTLDLQVDDCDDVLDDEDKYSVKIWFEFVPNYPNEVPSFGVEESNNLLEEDENELIELLTNESNSLIGTEMIFLLVSAAKEWLNTRKDESSRRKEEMIERRKREAEEAEMKRFEGTRVTVDSFMKWKLNFDAEMQLLREKAGDKDLSKELKGKLSGRQLFEKDATLNESDLKFLEEDQLAGETVGKDISYDMAGVAVDTSLFDDVDDDDEDDEDWIPE